MKAWLFDQIFWPKPGNRLLYPYPGRLWEPSIGIEQYHGHLQYLKRPLVNPAWPCEGPGPILDNFIPGQVGSND